MFSEIKDTNSSTVACCQASALSAVRLLLSLPKSWSLISGFSDRIAVSIPCISLAATSGRSIQ